MNQVQNLFLIANALIALGVGLYVIGQRLPWFLRITRKVVRIVGDVVFVVGLLIVIYATYSESMLIIGGG